MGSWLVKALILVPILLSVLYVHFRGRERHKFFKQLFDHSAFVAPVNVLMYLFSRVPTTPYIPVSHFKDLEIIQAHWQEIREEAQALLNAQQIRAAQHNDDAGFNSFFKFGWKRFYLKWYGDSHPSAEQLCPRTVALVRNLPSVKAAMFAYLPVDGKLNPHRDPFAGSLRYHLGLITPNDDRCFISVDGERYSWRDGEGVVFDETYIHWVANTSGKDRLIFFADIERPMNNRIMQAFNSWVGRNLVAQAASPNQEGDRVGAISKLFRYADLMGQQRRRFKRWNPTVYKLTRIGLIVAIVALIWFL